MTEFGKAGHMSGPIDNDGDNRPADEKAVEMLEDQLPSDRRKTLRTARAAEKQVNTRKR